MRGIVILAMVLMRLAQPPLPLDTPSLERDFEAAMQREGINGAVVLLVERDTVAYLNAFGQDQHGNPLNPDTVFDLGRAAEPFLTTALMIQAEQGRISPDVWVRNALPDYTLPEARLSMTITDLLIHMAGLGGDLSAPLFQASDWPDLSAAPAPPIKRFSYCPACTALSVTTLERSAGRPVEAILNDTIFYPLHMDSTVLEDGTLFTTAPDLSHFLTALLQAGRWKGVQLVKPETLEVLFKARGLTGRDRTEQYGFGWWVQPESGLNVREISQDRILNARDMGRYQAQITLVPGYGRGMVILTDQPTRGLDSLMDVLIEHFIAWTPPEFDPVAVNGVVGTLHTSNSQFSGEIRLQADESGGLIFIYGDEQAAAEFVARRTLAFDLPESGRGTLYFLEDWRSAQAVLMLAGQTAIYQRQY